MPTATLDPGNAPSPSPASRRRIVYFALIGAALFQILQWGVYRPVLWPGVDFGKHWDAALAVLAGQNNFINNEQSGELWLGFNYPQATAFMFLWLACFTRAHAEIVWKLMNLALVMLIWLAAWRIYRPRAITPGPQTAERGRLLPHWWLISLILTVFYYPLISSLYIGNIDPVNAFLAVGVTAALLRGSERLAGVLWALVTLIKMMPVILLWPFTAWRRWRVVGAFMGVMAVYFFILLGAGRIKWEWFFVREVIPRIPFTWRGISISPFAFTLKAFGHWGQLDWFNSEPMFTRLMRVYLALGLTAWAIVMTALRRRRAEPLAAVEAALVFIPLLSPLLEYHHFVWIMPALLLQCRRILERGMRKAILIPLATGWILINAGFIIFFQFSSIYFLHCVPTLGYLLVLAMTLIDLFGKQTPGTGDAAPAAPEKVNGVKMKF